MLWWISRLITEALIAPAQTKSARRRGPLNGTCTWRVRDGKAVVTAECVCGAELEFDSPHGRDVIIEKK